MIIQSQGYSTDTDYKYNEIIKNGYAGFANAYLGQTWNETKLVTKAKPEIYSKLMKIDAELGTKNEKQLFGCCRESTDLNVIKVNI